MKSIRKLICLASAIFAGTAASEGAPTLLQYTFPTTGTFSASTTDPGVTGSNVVKPAGSTLNTFIINSTLGYATGPVLQVAPVTNAIAADTAVSLNSVFEFTISPVAGYTYSISTLEFDVARGGPSTPRGYVIRSSQTGTTDLASAAIPTTRPALTNVPVSLASVAALQNLTTPTTFQFYIYAPSSGSSEEYDNITLTGTAIPEPASAALLVAGASFLGLARRRV